MTLLRPQQWVKNLFLWPVLLLTPTVLTWSHVALVAQATLVFCCASSMVYIVNDWCDREADRAHPVKRHRPLAAGTVSPGAAAALLGGLAVGLGLTIFDLSWRFQLVAGGYLALNLLYSFALKRVAILDVLCIAMGFVLRVVGGGVVVAVAPSAWLLIITGLLALFLALAKRRDDLVHALGSEHRRSLEGYNLAFLDVSVPVVLGTLLVAYLTYTTDTAVMARLGTTNVYTTSPFVVAGILRYLQITYVEERSGNPTRIALSDRFMLCAVAGWVATFAVLIYF